jgi:hypothetical protein
MGNWKKVYLSRIDIEGTMSFDSFLRNKLCHKYIEIKEKKIEISHIDVQPNYIVGLFVSTQDTGIAPLHTPGDEEDYSAVPVPDGKGFAYPNVFVYLRELNVLAWEKNYLGLSESGMADFVNSKAIDLGLDLVVKFMPIMNLDAAERISKFLEISKVELKVTEPTEFLRGEYAENGAMSDIESIAKKTNASRSMSITLVAQEKSTRKLNKKSILDILTGFIPIKMNKHGRDKNKMIIVGTTRDEDGRIIEEAVNIVINRYEDKFRLEKLKIAPHLQIQERKEGILGVVLSKFNYIKKLL